MLKGLLKIQFPLIISPREARGSATRLAWGKQACQANGME